MQPELHDALVPAMILQPILENAYRHGLSHLPDTGVLKIEARKENARVRLDVLNTGIGLNLERPNNPTATTSAWSMFKIGCGSITVRISRFQSAKWPRPRCLFQSRLPLQLCEDPPQVLAEYGE